MDAEKTCADIDQLLQSATDCRSIQDELSFIRIALRHYQQEQDMGKAMQRAAEQLSYLLSITQNY